MMSFFARGFVLGLSVSAAVGPVAILCINRSLQRGFWSGFLTGCGSTTGGLLYSCFAVFGLSLITSILVQQQYWVQIAGGVFLFYLGLRAFWAKVGMPVAMADNNRSRLGDYISGFLLSLMDPVAIVVFAAMLASLGLGVGKASFSSESVFVAGIGVGGLLWWFFLSFVLSRFLRTRLNEVFLRWLNYFSGIILLGFSLSVFLKLKFL